MAKGPSETDGQAPQPVVIHPTIASTSSKRQRYLLILAERGRERGITVGEVRDAAMHHGRVSGALSALHKGGKLVRLAEMRKRCRVYVLPEFVDGRETQPYGVTRRVDRETLEAVKVVERWLRRYDDEEALFDLAHEDEPLAEALWKLVAHAKGETHG